jgi:hypothetical protein
MGAVFSFYANLHFDIGKMGGCVPGRGKIKNSIQASFSKMEGMAVSSHTLAAGRRGLRRL